MIKSNETVYTDVLVIGGGIGGLCAAAAAGENGASVIVAEKANTKRSGSGATGNDHFLCYYPKQHGDDINVIVKEALDSLIGLCHDPSLTKKYLEHTFEMAQRWESWGITMRPYGDEYEFMGHAYPGRPRIWLKYSGGNQKLMLTKAAKKVGAKILNHHPAIELIREGDRVVGALCLDVSKQEPSYTTIIAKKVILATGTANRLYPSAASPGWLCNTAFCPSCTGGAQAQAWRIGAKLCNMELPNRHAGLKYFARCGKSSWIGIYKYPDGKLLGPFVTSVDRYLGDITCDVWNSAYTDVLLNGQGPAYIDCSMISEEEQVFMRHAMVEEGLTGLLGHMDAEGIDLRKHAVEFMQYEPHLIGRGLEVDENAECSIKGLYAAGDMMGNVRGDISAAAVFGWFAGEVVALGEGVTKFKVGDRVSGEAHCGCGHCDNCCKGFYNLCYNYGKPETGHRHYGFTYQGAYAQYNAYDIKALTKLPDNVSYNEASLTDTAGTALQAIRLTGVVPGGYSLIIGPGPIGIFAMEMAKAMGSKTIMVGRRDRLKLAEKLGADYIIDYEKVDDIVKAVRDITGGVGVDQAYECAGSDAAMEQTILATKKNGHVAFVALPTVDLHNIPVKTLVMNQIHLHGSRANPSCAKDVLELVSSGAIDAKGMITHVFPLSDFKNALEVFDKRLDGAMKVVIRPNEMED